MRSVDELFSVVVREQDDDARWSAIRELHALGTREVFERGVALCRSTDPADRVAGADIIGQLSAYSDEGLQVLESMLADGEASVLESVVHALAQKQDARTIEALARLSAHDASNVRWAVATALEDLIGDERAEKVLLKLMRDGDTSVRDRATFAVGSLSDHDSPRIRAALAERLRDDDACVANEAALGLARRRDARAIPYIATAVEASKDAEIEEAVDEITSPDMLTELLKARDALGDAGGLRTLIDRCRTRI
ncbi:MAG TPA: HEAT repeat domain-containing protein [Thermoanaerobaculia bacterium]|nr:HEAT repeat domain-containing protein [Thermoanaerobaculia bacterium]